MTVEAQVRAAKNPQEALLAVARGIDEVLARLEQTRPADGWGEWEEPAESREDWNRRRAFEVEHSEDLEKSLVTLPSVSEEKKAKRRALAEAMALDTEFPGIEAVETYAKGGPVWLYTGNRDFVMGLPDHMRAEMVRDVLEDDPETAHDMGKDILKQADNKAIAHTMAEQTDVRLHG